MARIVCAVVAVYKWPCGMPTSPTYAARLCHNACLHVVFPVPLQCLMQELSKAKANLEMLCRCWRFCLLCLVTLSLSSAERHLLQTQNTTEEGSTATRGVVYCQPRTQKNSLAWHSTLMLGFIVSQAVRCQNLLWQAGVSQVLCQNNHLLMHSSNDMVHNNRNLACVQQMLP